MSLISLMHLLLCAAFLCYMGFRVYRMRNLTLFHLTSISYTATALILYPFVGVDRWAIVNEATISRGFHLALIFVIGCLLTDLLFYYRRRPRSVISVKPNAFSFLCLAGLFAFGFWGFLRYFFSAGAWLHFGEVLSAVRAGTEYYDAREAVAAQLMAETGRGVAHGTTAVYVIIPVVVAVGLYCFRHFRQWSYLLLALAAVIQALLTVSISMERAPVLFALTLPVLAWVAAKFRPQDAMRAIQQRIWRVLAAGATVFLAIGLLIYSWTDVGENPLLSMLDRIFMSPCITANYYLAAFPEEFSFRGWSNILSMGATLGESVTGTRDIARFVTHGIYAYNPNSGMLATAYSGAGMLGCMVVMLLYLLAVVVVDSMFRRYSPELRSLNLLINLYSLPMLSNTPFMAALASGFFIPSLFLGLYLFSCRRRISAVGSLHPTNQPASIPSGLLAGANSGRRP